MIGLNKLNLNLNLKCPPGDENVAVDNEQRVGRSSGRIREGSSVRVDICTTMSFLSTDSTLNLQQKEKN